MAQLFCLLLLVTIPLLVVSNTAEPWPKEGANYSFPYNCGSDWTTRLSCDVGQWIWELKCNNNTNPTFKVMIVALPPKSSVSNIYSPRVFYQDDMNVINLMNVTGGIKACLINNTFFLTNESRQNIDRCVKNCQCSDVFNDQNGNQINQNISIQVQSTDERTVGIQIEQEHYFIRCTGGKTSAALQFHPEPKSWIDALKTCRRGDDSELVHITNSCVWCDVQSLLNNKTNTTVLHKGVWIGLERSIFGCDPKWMWTSGNDANYTHWNSERADRLNNHCGKVVWIESKNYTWVDEGCFEVLPFICTVLK
ncbi:uncharacterized protein LOC122983437 isoform X2 [Scomber scombrus]